MSQQLFSTTPFLNQDLEGDQRKAALLLHGMPAVDQQWILAQLPKEQGEDLQRLLDELKELGIPADGSLTTQAFSLPPRAVDSASVGGPLFEGERWDKVVEGINSVDPGCVWGILKDEPVGLIAALLNLHSWQWASAVLEGMGPVKRHQVDLIQTYRNHDSVNPAFGRVLRERLLTQFSQRLGTRQEMGARLPQGTIRRKLTLPRHLFSWWWGLWPALRGISGIGTHS